MPSTSLNALFGYNKGLLADLDLPEDGESQGFMDYFFKT